MEYAFNRALAYLGMPRSAFRFMLRALLLTAAWKAAYIFFLYPHGLLDQWLVRVVGDATVRSLGMFSEYAYTAFHTPASYANGTLLKQASCMILLQGRWPVLDIQAPCNGLDLMVLSAGFVWCFPGSFRRKAFFMPLCAALVFGINVLRCCLLCDIRVQLPDYFDFMHKFFFNMAAYVTVFASWILFVGFKNRGSTSDIAVD